MFHLKLNRSVIPTHCLRFKGRGWGFQILESYLLWGPLKWMKHNRPLAQEPALKTLQIPGFHENNHGVAVKGWVRRGGIDRSSCGESKPNTEPPQETHWRFVSTTECATGPHSAHSTLICLTPLFLLSSNYPFQIFWRLTFLPTLESRVSESRKGRGKCEETPVLGIYLSSSGRFWDGLHHHIQLSEHRLWRSSSGPCAFKASLLPTVSSAPFLWLFV